MLLFNLILVDLNAKKLPQSGFFIDKNRDTSYCTFKIPLYRSKHDEFKIDMIKLQGKIKIKLTRNRDTKTLLPDSIYSIHFSYNNRVYELRSINQDISLNGKSMFLQTLSDGRIKYYLFYRKIPIFKPGVNWYHYPILDLYISPLRLERVLIQKDEQQLHKLTRRYYNNELKDLISDCPDIYEKYIQTEEYNYKNISKLIFEYNNCFLK